jgi:hypothetical protein
MRTQIKIPMFPKQVQGFVNAGCHVGNPRKEIRADPKMRGQWQTAIVAPTATASALQLYSRILSGGKLRKQSSKFAVNGTVGNRKACRQNPSVFNTHTTSARPGIDQPNRLNPHFPIILRTFLSIGIAVVGRKNLYHQDRRINKYLRLCPGRNQNHIGNSDPARRHLHSRSVPT